MHGNILCLNKKRGAEIFGQGLGASLVANDGSIYSGFIVPHNEYIRFYFDNGIVGLILMFGSLMFVLINFGVRLPKKVRIYYFSFILGFYIVFVCRQYPFHNSIYSSFLFLSVCCKFSTYE